MKIILSQDFISDGERVDSTLIMSKYFLVKALDIAFTGWDELVSDSMISRLRNNMSTKDHEIEGLWEPNSEVLKIHLDISSEAFDINSEIIGFNLGYFYYINQRGEEKPAFVIIPAEANKDSYGNLLIYESQSLELILGSNMINVIQVRDFKAKIKCSGELEDTEFLEGHGMIRGVNTWSFPESTSPVYISSAKSYLLGGLREYWKDADVFPSPEGLVGENLTHIKIPISISLTTSTPELIVGGLGGTIKIDGSWEWEEYAVTSSYSTYISSGVSNISSLPNGQIIVNSQDEGMIEEVNWNNKTVKIGPCPQKDVLRVASLSVSSSAGNKNPVTVQSPKKTIEQENSTSVWELNIPIQGYDQQDRPIVRLDWATLRGITGRTNKDFVIVDNPGEEPKEGNWIRVDCDWTGWKDYVNVVINKIDNSGLWWDVKIVLEGVIGDIIATLPPTPPICYIVLGGSEVREFVLEFPESLFPGMPQPTYSKRIITPILPTNEEILEEEEKIYISGSELMEIKELEIFPEDKGKSIWLESSTDSVVTIAFPDYSPVDMIFANGDSHGLVIPPLGLIEVPMLVIDSEEELNEDIHGKILVTSKESGKRKELNIIVKKGRKRRKSSTVKMTSSKKSIPPIYFHSTGISLTGLWETGSDGIFLRGFNADGVDLEKTTLRIKIGNSGYEPIHDFGWIREPEGTYTLLTKLPPNSTGNIIGDKSLPACLDLWSWEKLDSIWSAPIQQGTTCVKIYPEVEPLKMSGAKNSVFPERVFWEIGGKEIEFVAPDGKTKTYTEQKLSIGEIEWLEGKEYLESSPELKLMNEKGRVILQPLFNVLPQHYGKEFKIHLKGSIIVNLPEEEKHRVGRLTTVPISFDLWINKPKLIE